MSSMMRMPANEACYLDLPIDGNKINFASPSKLTLEKFCQKKKKKTPREVHPHTINYSKKDLPLPMPRLNYLFM